jgi:hypothetical protein
MAFIPLPPGVGEGEVKPQQPTKPRPPQNQPQRTTDDGSFEARNLGKEKAKDLGWMVS